MSSQALSESTLLDVGAVPHQLGLGAQYLATQAPVIVDLRLDQHRDRAGTVAYDW
ncbi:hypothetical protein ACQP1G_24430 [Nocardia sp. CA-107356]|uniref:hypothetical protein n=1 Tax=Nocardia sp. CA-107356 TaxID=3239972 RepID=UPI003D902D4D